MKKSLYNNDCFMALERLPPNTVSLVLCDLPYSLTANKWDEMIPLAPLWRAMRRVAKPDAVYAMFGTEPFTSALITSNRDGYRYSWIWEKESPTGFLNCAYAPLKLTEDICVFSPATVGSLSKNPIRYFPQGTVAVNEVKRNNPKSKLRKNWGYGGHNKINTDAPYLHQFTGYPTNILKFPRDRPQLHPAQKPIALLEYLIRTYTRIGEVVLDPTMGSGSTGVACARTGRSFIGIERDAKYYDIAKSRIENAELEAETGA